MSEPALFGPSKYCQILKNIFKLKKTVSGNPGNLSCFFTLVGFTKIGFTR